jgi:Tfp pilus assembly protein PilO
MNMSLGSSQVKEYMLPILTFVVILTIIPLVALGWVGQVMDVFKTLDVKKEQVRVMQAKLQALEGLNDEENRKQLVQKVEPALPSVADPSGALGTIEQVAAASGVRMSAANYANGAVTKGQGGESLVKATVTVAGDYAAINAFLKATEKAARILEVETLQISSGAGAVAATMGINAPYMGVLTDLGAPDAALPGSMSAQQQSTLNRLSALSVAPFAPTDEKAIAGKANPF